MAKKTPRKRNAARNIMTPDSRAVSTVAAVTISNELTYDDMLNELEAIVIDVSQRQQEEEPTC